MTTVELASSSHTHHEHELVGSTTPRRFAISIEQIAYLAIFVLALLMHLWQLDGRALHHDETLHASYSWYIFQGQSYMHDPLLHGPFLYYMGAVMYFLFGDNDFTARLGFALFGTVMTILPYLVRREIGKPAALLASLYLLISPSFLYMGRFARHDIYSVTFELLVFISILRYTSTRKARWLYTGVIAFALMFVNQETSYLFLVMVAMPLVFMFLWRVMKPGILVVMAMAVAVASLVFVLPGEAQTGSENKAIRDETTNEIQVKEPGPLFGWGPLETADNDFALRIRNRSDNDSGKSLVENFGRYIGELWTFFRHPAVLSAIGITLGGLALLVWLIWFWRDAAGASAWDRAWQRGDAVMPVYASLVANKRWLIAIGLFLLIYVFFFTAFLTNILGIITGTTGSLLYWMAQHHVERGGQPTHYYGVLLAVYEPLLILWVIVGYILLAVAGVKRLMHRAPVSPQDRHEPRESTSETAPAPPAPTTDEGETLHPQTTTPTANPSLERQPAYVPLFLGWWSIVALLMYTWAGEKMPWLSTHIALPMTLFAAWALQRVLFGHPDRPTIPPLDPSRRVLFFFFIGLFLATSGLNYVVITTFVGAEVRTNVPGLILVALVMVLFLMVILLAGMNWGWRWALGVLAICITLVGGMYTFRSSYRLAYVTGDVPREMYIYTQTSPDVRNVVRKLEEISYRRTRGLHMPVMYDNETVWTWYLRNFTNAQRSGTTMSPPANDVMAIVLLQENYNNSEQNRDYLEPFIRQRYPLRWWFPEDGTYRLRKGWADPDEEPASLLARVLRQPFQDETLIELWEFLIYRDPGQPLGSTDFILAVRPEIADQMGWGLGATLSGE